MFKIMKGDKIFDFTLLIRKKLKENSGKQPANVSLCDLIILCIVPVKCE